MSRTKALLRQFWHDQSGFVLTAELVLISTLLVLGLIVGLTEVQTAVVGELADVGTAIGSLNQSYSYRGMISQSTFFDCGVKAYTAGSAFNDLRDECDIDLAMSCAFSLGSTSPMPESHIDHEKRGNGKDESRKSKSGKKRDSK